MADIPPSLTSIRVVWVDPGKEKMASCTEAQEEARVEDLWRIQTISDWSRLAGKKLGLRLADGNYVRGWLRDRPGAVHALVLLRESNEDEEIEIRTEKIVTVEIIEVRVPPLLRFQTVGDRLWLWNRQVSIELKSGERMVGRVEDSSSSDRDLILRSDTGESISVLWERIGVVEANDPESPPRKRKRVTKSKGLASKRPLASPSNGPSYE